MKAMKKIVSLLLVLTMAMGLSLTAFAEEPAISPLAVQNGGIITVSGPQLKGKEVTIVRMFTGNIGQGDAVGYTLETAWQGFFDQELTKTDGQHASSQDAYEHVSKMQSEKTTTNGTTLIEFAKKAKEAYKKAPDTFNGLKTTQTAAEADSVTFNNLKSGYYLVLPESGSTIADRVTDAMLVNVSDDEHANITLKTEYPIVVKTVVSENGHGNSAKIGDKVNFELKSKVPNMNDYKTYFFEFKDTMSEGLTFNNDVQITIGDNVILMDGNYTVQGDANPILIIFNDLKKVDGIKAGDVIKVTYSATLNKDAVMGQNSNTNSAELEYSNDPSSDEHGTSEPSVTHTYTFDVEIHKYAEGAQGTQLSGAVFQLKDAEGELIKLIDNKDGTYRIAKTDEEGVESFQTVAGKDIAITGLKADKYQLAEIAAPEGYNPLPKPVEFAIKAEYNLDGTLKDGFPKYVVNAGAESPDKVINVENKKGSFLPETGSIGTIGLTILGVVLVVGGLGFTSGKKKQQA